MMELFAPRHDPAPSTTPETQCTQNFGGGKVSVIERDGHYIVSFERAAHQPTFKATKSPNGRRKTERGDPKRLELKVALRLSKNDAEQIGLNPASAENILSDLKSKIGRGHLFRADGYAGRAFIEILGRAEIIEFKNAKVKRTDERSYTFSNAKVENAWIAGKRRNGTFNGVVQKREVLDSASLPPRPDPIGVVAPDATKSLDAGRVKPDADDTSDTRTPAAVMGIVPSSSPRGFLARFLATAAVITCAILAFFRPSEKRPTPTDLDGLSSADSTSSAEVSAANPTPWDSLITLPSGDTFRFVKPGPEVSVAQDRSQDKSKENRGSYHSSVKPPPSNALVNAPDAPQIAAGIPSDQHSFQYKPPLQLRPELADHDESGHNHTAEHMDHEHGPDFRYPHKHHDHAHGQSGAPTADEDHHHTDRHEDSHAVEGHSHHHSIVPEVEKERRQGLALGYRIGGNEPHERQIEFSSFNSFEVGKATANIAVAHTVSGEGLTGSFTSTGPIRLEGGLELVRPTGHLHEDHDEPTEGDSTEVAAEPDHDEEEDAREKRSFFLGVARGDPHSPRQLRGGAVLQDDGLGIYALGRQEILGLKIPLTVQVGGLAHQRYGEISLGANVSPFSKLGFSGSYRARSPWAGRNDDSFEVFHAAAKLSQGPFAVGLRVESHRGDNEPETFDSLTEPLPHHHEEGLVFQPEASWRFSRDFTLGGTTEFRSGQPPRYQIDCEINKGPCVLTLSGGHDQEPYVRTGIKLR